MSNGERSCALYSGCPKPSKERGENGLGCDVDCSYYKWDGETPPDSVRQSDVLVGGRGTGKLEMREAEIRSRLGGYGRTRTAGTIDEVAVKPKSKPYKAPTKNQAKRLRRKRRGE